MKEAQKLTKAYFNDKYFGIVNQTISFRVLLGGLAAVTYTDVLQCTIMLLGGVVLSGLGKEL